MRFLVLPVGVAAFFVIAGPVLVAAGDADVCAKGTGDEKIAACTRSIGQVDLILGLRPLHGAGGVALIRGIVPNTRAGRNRVLAWFESVDLFELASGPFWDGI